MKYRDKKSEINCCNCDLFRTCPIFENADENNNIVKKGIIVARNQDIYKAGQPFTSFAIVRSGLLKSWNVNKDGKEGISSFFLQGDLIGVDVVYNEKHISTITALTNTEICTISSDELKKLFQTNMVAFNRGLWLVSRYISFRHYLLLVDTEKRLAGFLYEIIMRLQLIKNNVVKLPIKQIDMASHLNLSPETINRTLRRWEEKGVISGMRNKQFLINDINILKDISSN